jgi:hypothetical protein
MRYIDLLAERASTLLSGHKDADPTDWQQSLSVFGQIAYRGSIPPNRIKVRGA